MPGVTKLQEPKAGKGQRGILWQYVVWAIRRINRPALIILPTGSGTATVTESEQQVMYDFTKARFASTANQTPVPFRCEKVDNTTIRIYRGSVSTALGTFTPSGFATGDVPPFTTTVSGDGYVYFGMTVDATTGDPTAVSNPTSGASLPADTATAKYKELGSFDTTSSVLTVQSNEIGDQSFVMCGGVDPEWSAG